MFLFMIMLIPAVLVFCGIRAGDKTEVAVTVSGAVTGVLVSLLVAAFSFRHRIPEYSFAANFLYYAAEEYIVPLLLLYIAYFFITKDTVEFRIRSFFPVTAGFFSVYMPYCIISASGSVFSFFELFVKPVLFLSMLVLASFAVFYIGKQACEKNIKRMVAGGVLLAFILFVPPFLNTLWILDVFAPAMYVLSAVYAFFAACLFFSSIMHTESID